MGPVCLSQAGMVGRGLDWGSGFKSLLGLMEGLPRINDFLDSSQTSENLIRVLASRELPGSTSTEV